MKWIMKRLPAITIFYLLFPILIFVIGWLKIYLAIPLVLIAAWAYYLVAKSYLSDKIKDDQSFFQIKYIYHYIIALALLLIWVYYSGNGGFAFQNSDWYKHNAILHHLIYNHWPIRFLEIQGINNVALVYYTAFYLPAAMIGKIWGWAAANIALFIWVYIGVVLTWLWLCRLSNKLSFWLVVLLMVFGGLDLLGNFIYNGQLLLGTASSEWWASLWQYSSNTTQLFWVPQQAIAAWLLISLFTYDYLERKSNSNVIFYFALSLLWSPLVSIGLLPYAVAIAFSDKLKKLLNFQNLVFGLVYLTILGLYFLSNLQQSKGAPSTSGWLWQNQYMINTLPLLIFFYIIEFGIYLPFCWDTVVNSLKREKIWWYIMIGFLIFAPFYKFGLFNDFAMRATIPSLFILVILIARTLFNPNYKQYAIKALLVLVLIFASSGFYFEMARGKINNKPNPEETSNLALDSLDKTVISQYLGTQNSIFFKYLAK